MKKKSPRCLYYSCCYHDSVIWEDWIKSLLSICSVYYWSVS